jgi:hypothetical protein
MAMIFVFTARVLVWLLMWAAKLTVAPSLEVRSPFDDEMHDRPKIDLEMQCPACGHAGMIPRYEVYDSSPGRKEGIRRGLVKLTCKTCGAFCRVEPIAKEINGKKPDTDVIGGTVQPGMTAQV